MRAGVDKIYFKASKITRDIDIFHNFQRLIQQENITILNVYVSKNRAPKYMQQKLPELREVDRATLILEISTYPLSN